MIVITQNKIEYLNLFRDNTYHWTNQSEELRDTIGQLLHLEQ